MDLLLRRLADQIMHQAVNCRQPVSSPEGFYGRRRPFHAEHLQRRNVEMVINTRRVVRARALLVGKYYICNNVVGR